MHLDSNLHRVRPCRDADVEAGIALWRESPRMVLRTEDAPAAIERFLGDARARGWLAGQDGRRGYLCHPAATESRQREGVDRAPVDVGLKDFATIGIACSHVMVLADNADARIVGRRQGWHERRDLAIYTSGEKR